MTFVEGMTITLIASALCVGVIVVTTVCIFLSCTLEFIGDRDFEWYAAGLIRIPLAVTVELVVFAPILFTTFVLEYLLRVAL